MAVACHGTVGFQHASMAIYNAWCDHVPIIILGGNHVDAAHRPFPVVWDHSAQDPISTIRDAIKWDDQPGSLQHFGESAVRAYGIAVTPPMGPVAISIDSDLQELRAKGKPEVPRLVPSMPAQGDANAVLDAANQLVRAEYPVIVVDRYARSQAGVDLLIELAELIQAPVIDRGSRMNFPNVHYLNQSFAQGVHIAKADVIIALEVTDVWGILNLGRDRSDPPVTERVAKTNVRLITIGSNTSSQNHSGCRKCVMNLPSRGCFFRPRRCQYENARALAQRFHILLVERHRREFDEIALKQKFSEQRLVPDKRCIRRFKQIPEELLRGSARGSDIESLLDVAAHDVRRRGGEFACSSGLHQSADLLEALQRDLVRQ